MILTETGLLLIPSPNQPIEILVIPEVPKGLCCEVGDIYDIWIVTGFK